MKSIICEWLIEIGILAVVRLHPEEFDYELDLSELRVYVCGLTYTAPTKRTCQIVSGAQR